MTPAAYFTPRRQRCFALLAGLVLLAGQLVLQQHVHADDTADGVCVVCVQGDHTPITASAVASIQISTVATPIVAPAVRGISAGNLTTYHPRAPPRS